MTNSLSWHAARVRTCSYTAMIASNRRGVCQLRDRRTVRLATGTPAGLKQRTASARLDPMSPDDLLAELGELATSLGPAVRPAGTEELLRSLTETARRLFGEAACSLGLVTADDSALLSTGGAAGGGQ